MYICSCHAVTDGAMRALIRSGKVRTFAQMAKTTGVATQCGICGRQAKELFYKIFNEEVAAGNISATADGASNSSDAINTNAAPVASESNDSPVEIDASCARVCAACTCIGCPGKAATPESEG